MNGKSIGIQKNDTSDVTRRKVIYWQNVPYGNGGNVVAVARSKGKEMARYQLVSTGKAVALKLEVENANWSANGMDLQCVKVYVVDSKWRKVSGAKGKVVFDVTGAAKLLAIDNGDHTSNMVHTQGNTVELHNGFALAILRAGQTPGMVMMKVSSDGLKKVERKLEVK